MLNQSELLEISEAIGKLFKAQGKYVDDDLRLVFLEEIKNWKYPIAAILAGIKSLYSADLREVKLAIIRQAVSSQIVSEQDTKTSKCPHCQGCGIVSMIRVDRGTSYAFACNCDDGGKQAAIIRNPGKKSSPAMVIPKWNGEATQEANHMMFQYFNAEFLKEKTSPGSGHWWDKD